MDQSPKLYPEAGKTADLERAKDFSPREFLATVRDENRRFYEDRRGLGALRDLQQTFAHPWVYLAELLQNAIDEKAKRIHIVAMGNDRLIFEHDGEPFTPDDVEALCARGVSTKGARTVGFMGVGFKAAFCAFQRVKISSGPWRFALCVSVAKGEQFGEVRRDWLGAVLPDWDESAVPPSGSMTCRFEFSEHLADLQPIERDVERVFGGDFSLVALLAWRGLEELRWNGLEWMLNRVQRTLPGGKSGFEILEAWDLALDVVRRWVLFAVEYCPSQPAIARFLEHRQLPLAQESVVKGDVRSNATSSTSLLRRSTRSSKSPQTQAIGCSTPSPVPVRLGRWRTRWGGDGSWWSWGSIAIHISSRD